MSNSSRSSKKVRSDKSKEQAGPSHPQFSSPWGMQPGSSQWAPHMWGPFMGAAPSPGFMPSPAATTQGKKPWDASSSSSSSDEDFKPKSKNSGRSSQQLQSKQGEKRRRGRPSNAEVAAANAKASSGAAAGSDDFLNRQWEIVLKYPGKHTGRVPLPFPSDKKCGKCDFYAGQVLMKPCGHFGFCFECVNTMREEALRMKRPSKCLCSDCYDLVTGWVQLYHVNQ